MASIIENATALIVGTIGLVVVAAVIASTNAEQLGTITVTVLSFVTVGMAVVLLVIAFKG